MSCHSTDCRQAWYQFFVSEVIPLRKYFFGGFQAFGGSDYYVRPQYRNVNTTNSYSQDHHPHHQILYYLCVCRWFNHICVQTVRKTTTHFTKFCTTCVYAAGSIICVQTVLQMSLMEDPTEESDGESEDDLNFKRFEFSLRVY